MQQRKCNIKIAGNIEFKPETVSACLRGFFINKNKKGNQKNISEKLVFVKS